MKSHCLLLLSLVLVATLAFPQSQSEAPPSENPSDQPARLRLILFPNDEFEAEARKKNIEGKVALKLVVDATGQVTEAVAVSGATALFQAAVDSAKKWQFAPPDNPPVVTTAEIAYGYPKECPGPISESGSVFASGKLLDTNHKPVAVWDSSRYELPPFFEQDRRAGVAGNLELSLSLDAEGNTSEIHVVQSLSPHLDEAAIKAVREWRFKPLGGARLDARDDLRLEITYKAMCGPQFY